MSFFQIFDLKNELNILAKRGSFLEWRTRAFVLIRWCLLFFFQAEDGIRDYKVTGVQTCALPICILEGILKPLAAIVAAVRFRNTLKDTKDAVYIFLALAVGVAAGVYSPTVAAVMRSGGRRGGGEGRSPGGPDY